MKKFNLKLMLLTIVAAFAGISSFAQAGCNQFVYFYADIVRVNNVKHSDIYGVSLEDGNAVLNPISLGLPYGAHIAFDKQNFELLVVNDANGAIQMLDINTGVLGTPIASDMSINGVTVAAINEDGKLLIGSNDGELLDINLTTDPYTSTVFAGGNDISGGDITFTNNGLYLASKPMGNLYSVLPGFENQLLGNVRNAVTGIAALEDGEGILVSSVDATAFYAYAVDGEGVTQSVVYPALLDGESFTLGNGDMASGCAVPSTVVGDCDAFTSYYVNHGPGVSGSDLYSVSYSGGSAILTFIENFSFEIHMAINAEEGTLYLVNANGSFVRSYDVATSTALGDLPIDGDINKIYAVVYNPADGLLYVGDDDDNTISTIDLTDGSVSLVANAPMGGGDLSLQGGKLIMGTRTGDKLYEIVDGAAVLIGNIPADINGMAQANNSTTVIMANFNSSVFTEVNIADASTVTTYPIMLNGEPFIAKNGDMAAGCADGGTPNPNEEFSCVGGDIISYTPGLRRNGNPITNPDRNNPAKASGAPQIDNTLNFVSLGYGGSIVIGFDGGAAINGPGNDILVVETTYGPVAGLESNFGVYPESADVLVTQDGVNFFYVGSLTTDEAASFDISAAGQGFTYITAVKVVDTTPGSSISDDAFDVDGIAAINGCGPIQLIVPTECYAETVVAFEQGLQTDGNSVAENRSDANKALGAPDASNASDGFVSLGNNGSITLAFSAAVLDVLGDDIQIFETSFSGDVCGLGDDESASIELSADGETFVSAGTICRDGLIDIAAAGLESVTQIRITSSASTLDGYDLDGVVALNGCGSIPSVEMGECNATEVLEYVEGVKFNGGSIATNRTDASQALGAPERIDELVFVSLGYGGSLTLAFDGAVPNMEGDDIEVVETTFGNSSCGSYFEFADVYVSIDGLEYIFAKTICRSDNFVDISDAGDFEFINFVKIVNNNELSNTSDAFDVDGVVALHNCVDTEEEGEGNGSALAEAGSSLTTYPNPTTGPAVIQFSTPVAQKTTIEVMDINGRTVATLFSQMANANQVYRVDFDGLSLPNGLYLTKMTTNAETVIEKMLIAR